MNLAFSCDDRYAPFVGICILNLLAFLPRDQVVHVYILDLDIRPENRERLQNLGSQLKNATITLVDAKALLKREIVDLEKYVHFGEHISIGTYIPFFIANLLDDLDKVLFLDADLVIRESLSDLYQIDISEYYAAVVRHFTNSYYGPYKGTKSGLFFDAYCKKYFQMDHTVYFNAGVMLLNLRKMRAERVSEKLLQTLFSFSPEFFQNQIEYHNQDSFNKVFYKKVVFLPLKYNVNPLGESVLNDRQARLPNCFVTELKSALTRPAVVHFTGMEKPWNNAAHKEFAWLFWFFVKRSPWSQLLHFPPKIPDRTFFYPLFMMRFWKTFKCDKIFLLLLKVVPTRSLRRKGKKHVRRAFTHPHYEIAAIKASLPSLFKKKTGYKMKIKAPKTFNQKLQWLKLNYTDPLIAICSDKVDMRVYLTAMGFESYLNDLYGVWSRAEDIAWDKLPDTFVLKTNQDPGGVWIVRDKGNCDRKKITEEIKERLSTSLGVNNGEFQYKEIKPKVLAEQYLAEDVGTPRDYNIFCFNGKPKYVQVDFGRQASPSRTFYDVNWKNLHFSTRFPVSSETCPTPEKLQEMLRISQTLSAQFPHVRIDTFYVRGRVYLGGMTFFHGSGMERFSDPKWDLAMGQDLQLPARNSSI